MLKIGLYPGSFKPYQSGHHKVLLKASEECNKVYLYVSLIDRENISGSNMAKVWNEQLLSIMPDNVEVQFLKSSPIRKVYEAIMLRNGMKHSSISMRVYSDEKDIQENFSYASLSACCPNIVGTEFLELCPISREETVNISGSEMREFLRKGNKEKFFEYLPEGIDKEEVFRLLTTLD